MTNSKENSTVIAALDLHELHHLQGVYCGSFRSPLANSSAQYLGISPPFM